MKSQLGMTPNINSDSPSRGNVTRFAGDALGEPRKQPLEVTFGSKDELRNPQLDLLRGRSEIQNNLAGAARSLRDRRSIQANQTPGGDLEPTKLEGFGS